MSEAIQPEADLGLGLFNKLDLNDGVEEWSKHIVKLVNKKELSVQKIKKAFDEKEYSTKKCIEKLIAIYEF